MVSEQFEENEYVQYIQRLQYVRYAVQNESKRVLSAEVYGLLTYVNLNLFILLYCF